METKKFVIGFFAAILALFILTPFSAAQDEGPEWVDISGAITWADSPLCAMVLANGQYMFTCEEGNTGNYTLNVPLDENGEITLFAFCEGLMPFKQVLAGDTGEFNVEMTICPDSQNAGARKAENRQDEGETPADEAPADEVTWVDISGIITYEDTPLCAMVLANGQYMFTCAEGNVGKYSLNVPLDENGEITLFTFCEGLMPYKVVLGGGQTAVDVVMTACGQQGGGGDDDDDPPADGIALAAGDGDSSEAVSLAWNAIGENLYYQVYRNTDADLETAASISPWQKLTTFSDNSAMPGVSYTYWVRSAADDTGTDPGEFSSPDTGWKALPAPENVNASDGMYPDSIRVSWAEVEGATHYQVRRGLDFSFEEAVPMTEWITRTSYQDNSGNPDIVYFYYIVAATDETGARPGEPGRDSGYLYTENPVTYPSPFADPNLEKAVREALNKPTGELTETDLESLTYLDAAESEITSLSGLSECPNLVQLFLQGNSIADISPLASLTSLESLDLSNNLLDSVSALSGLTSLTFLSVCGNNITDISPLGTLTALTTLYVCSNNITNLNPVSTLTALTFLDFSKNKVSDATPLGSLAALTNLMGSDNLLTDLSALSALTTVSSLSLSNNGITDISPLSAMTGLSQVILTNNQIADLTPLSALANLAELWLDTNSIVDISPLVANANIAAGDLVSLNGNPLSSDSCFTHIPVLEARTVTVNHGCGGSMVVNFPDPNLENAVRTTINKSTGDIYASDLVGMTSLYAMNKGITDITGLEYCTDLVNLSLSGNQISDLTQLSGLTGLQQLYLGNNKITDLTPLTLLVNLNTLELHSNQITDIASLAGMTQMQYMTLENNQITSIGPLNAMTQMERLSLQNNQIVDVSPLSGMVSLVYLSAYNNQIADISTLAPLTALTQLYLYNNQITNIGAVNGMTQLTYLSLYNNQISDLTPLAGLTNLKTLYLYYNQITDLTPLSGLTSLIRLNLNSNLITSVAPLSGLTALEELNLNYNQIGDVSPLGSLTSLVTLSLSNNQVADISALSALTSVKELNLFFNQITSITAVASMTSLSSLSLSSNQIEDIGPIVNNMAIGHGDVVSLKSNPLNATSCGTYIPILISKGVAVSHDCI